MRNQDEKPSIPEGIDEQLSGTYLQRKDENALTAVGMAINLNPQKTAWKEPTEPKDT